MNCPNCGNPLNATDTHCSFCGAHVQHQQVETQHPKTTTASSSHYSDSAPLKKEASSKKKVRTIILLILAAIALVAGIFIFSYISRMRKTQTVELSVPTIDRFEESNQVNIEKSEAITFIIDGKMNDKGESKEGEGMIYYYEGKPNLENNNLVQLKFDKEGEKTIREMLKKRNEDLLKEYNKLKMEREKGNIENDSIFKERAKELRIKIKNDDKAKKPSISIKPTPTASYADVVRMLDEMQICQISTWQVETLNDHDKELLRKNGINVNWNNANK